MPHSGPQDLADPADDRPLTHNDAETVYQISLTAARNRYAELGLEPHIDQADDQRRP